MTVPGVTERLALRSPLWERRLRLPAVLLLAALFKLGLGQSAGQRRRSQSPFGLGFGNQVRVPSALRSN